MLFRTSSKHVTGLAVVCCVIVLQLLSSTTLGAAAESKPDGELKAIQQLRAAGQSEAAKSKLAALIQRTPDLSPARWLNGEVKAGKNWERYDLRATNAEHLSALSGYEQMRGDKPLSIVQELELADWCAAHSLTDRERFHVYNVVMKRNQGAALTNAIWQRTSPANLLPRLGLANKPGLGWVHPADLAAAQEKERAAARSMATWSPLMKEIAAWLPKQDLSGRREALAKFKAIADPAAIPAMEAVLFPESGEAKQVVIEQLGRIKAPEAAFALAKIAVYHPTDSVRHQAALQLHEKPEDSYVPLLLSVLSTPIEHRYEYIQTPQGDVIAKHQFVRETEDKKVVMKIETKFTEDRSADAAPAVVTPQQRERLETQKLQLQLEAQNKELEKVNQPVYEALDTAIGESLPHDSVAIWSWWNDRNEVYVTPKPVVDKYATSTVVVNPKPQKYDCLAAGTPVWTDRGLVKIEQIRAGDMVLSQSPQTGELAYKIVYQTTVRPPERLVSITTDRGTIVASGGHPFWVVGEGWVRARKLPLNGRLYSENGDAAIENITDQDERVASYNLMVADFHTYFVGENLVLSHDNTVRQPVSAAIPGLPIK